MKNYPTHVPCRHYGDGWYCDASCSFPAPGNPHDYNPDADLEKACSRFWIYRKAKGRFFGHIDGRHVEAHVFEYDGERAIIAATKKPVGITAVKLCPTGNWVFKKICFLLDNCITKTTLHSESRNKCRKTIPKKIDQAQLTIRRAGFLREFFQGRGL